MVDLKQLEFKHLQGVWQYKYATVTITWNFTEGRLIMSTPNGQRNENVTISKTGHLPLLILEEEQYEVELAAVKFLIVRRVHPKPVGLYQLFVKDNVA